MRVITIGPVKEARREGISGKGYFLYAWAEGRPLICDDISDFFGKQVYDLVIYDGKTVRVKIDDENVEVV